MTLARIPTDLMQTALVEAAESRVTIAEARCERLRELLEATLNILTRNVGWLPHEDQMTIRTARAEVEEAK